MKEQQTIEQRKIKLRNEFNLFGDMNDKIIQDKNREGILNVAIILNKYLNPEIIGLCFNGNEEKEVMKHALKQHIINSEVEGYITIFDSKATTIDRKTNKMEVKDCVIRSLCSPILNIKEMVFYDNHTKKITSKTIMYDSEIPEHKERIKGMRDEWNLWGTPFDNDNPEDVKLNQEYQKFKQENPDKFK